MAEDNKKKECSRVEIEPAENGGFTVKKYYREKADNKKSEKGGLCCGPAWIEPKTYAFSTLDELSSFLHASFASGDKEGRVVARQ